MTRTLIVGLLVAVVVLAPVGAQQPKSGEAMIYGGGVLSCGTWLTQEDRIIFTAWVQGFISGVGYADIGLKHTDVHGMIAFIDQYCTAHPIDTIARASKALVAELRVKTP